MHSLLHICCYLCMLITSFHGHSGTTTIALVPVPVAWSRGHSKLFLLITVLLLRYSAASWAGLWPLWPYFHFGDTGAPTFNCGVY